MKRRWTFGPGEKLSSSETEESQSKIKVKSITANPMITDVDTCLKDIADWYIRNRRGITEPELEAILLKHCESEAEVKKFVQFLEMEPGQIRFRTLLRERKEKYGS